MLWIARITSRVFYEISMVTFSILSKIGELIDEGLYEYDEFET